MKKVWMIMVALVFCAGMPCTNEVWGWPLFSKKSLAKETEPFLSHTPTNHEILKTLKKIEKQNNRCCNWYFSPCNIVGAAVMVGIAALPFYCIYVYDSDPSQALVSNNTSYWDRKCAGWSNLGETTNGLIINATQTIDQLVPYAQQIVQILQNVGPEMSGNIKNITNVLGKMRLKWSLF